MNGIIFVKKLREFLWANVTFRETRSRAKIVSIYLWPQLKLAIRWQFRNGEKSNFNYPLTPINLNHLAHVISVVSGNSHSQIISYFEELESDSELRSHLTSGVKTGDSSGLFKFDYARRYGWYALVRSLKPKLVVETGVDQGVGACVISSALLRNITDGYVGGYLGTEINENAAKLFTNSKYVSVGHVIFGDSIETLAKLDSAIDLFINDSDHSSEYESKEYFTIGTKLSKSCVIIGDNAHVSNSLSEYSIESDRRFLFFSEKPLGHWYPGAGIGISFV